MSSVAPDDSSYHEGSARLRNRIAHGCASVDVERLWQELPDGLHTLELFVAAITKRVEDEAEPT